jgi:hypothetical protein
VREGSRHAQSNERFQEDVMNKTTRKTFHKTGLAMLLAAASLPALAMQVSGVNMADSANVGGKPLVLNGAGLRTKFGLADVYVMGLYLPAKSKDANSIINEQAPRRVTDTLENAFHEGLQANLSKPELQKLQPKIAQLDQRFVEVGAVKEGDILNLDFGADGSTQITYNGQQKAAVAGSDLSSALLKIWLGSHPVQNSLKQEILTG